MVRDVGDCVLPLMQPRCGTSHRQISIHTGGPTDIVAMMSGAETGNRHATDSKVWPSMSSFVGTSASSVALKKASWSRVPQLLLQNTNLACSVQASEKERMEGGKGGAGITDTTTFIVRIHSLMLVHAATS